MTYGAPKSILSGTTGGKNGKKKKVKLPKKPNAVGGKIMIKDDRLDVDFDDELAFAVPK